LQTHYYELKVTPSLPLEYYYDFINTVFDEAFEEDENSLILRSQEPLEDIAWAIENFTQALGLKLAQEAHVTLELEKRKHEDWIAQYQQSVQPVEVGSFYIRPSWHAPKEGLIDIIIDPALAFGSGHHPTTASCLEAIDTYVDASKSVLDVGCGSGILAIAAAKKGAVVDACDTDEVSLEHTQQNCLQNSVTMRELFLGSASNAKQTYDVVVANIVADVLGFIAHDIARVTRPKGVVILSGILDKYEANVLKSYKNLELLARIQRDEWVTLVMQKGE